MMNEGSLIDNFNHKIIRTEIFEDMKCWVIESTPIEESEVIWGKKISWISQEDFFTLKTESYDEDLYLVKTEISSEIIQMGGKKLPSKFVIIPADNPGNKTIVILKDIIFNQEIKNSFFSQQNMKRIR
jgi:outer membrane lipoprotein-sorting protein